jgi:hypothetical protein
MTTKTKAAHIAVKNSRLKTYKSPANSEVVYLKDGDEFQIELFNSHEYSVLAKIWMNDTIISESGLVLKPGQRVFLERYIDTNNKFVFRTYEVDGTDKEVLNAIKNNGSVKVIYYREKVVQNSGYVVNVNPSWRSWNTPGTASPTPMPYCGTTITSSSNFVGGSTTTNTAFYSSTSTGAIGSNGPSGPSGIQANYETGRVEKGSSSNQNFSSVFMEFENYPCETVYMQILAESNKPAEISDLRNYCSGCGTRMKKQTWKFCPSCGTKID